MSTAIDLIGSVIIAGFVLLMGLRLNMNVTSTALSSTTSVTTQESIVEAAKIFETDLKKMGYGISDPTTVISVADSNRLRFLADMNRNGTIDSVEWYTGNLVTKSSGLQARVLYRKYNNGTPSIVATNVVTFSLRYLDQNGSVTATKSNIAMVESTLEISTPYRVADQINPDVTSFVTTIWREGRLTARNVRRHG